MNCTRTDLEKHLTELKAAEEIDKGKIKEYVDRINDLVPRGYALLEKDELKHEDMRAFKRAERLKKQIEKALVGMPVPHKVFRKVAEIEAEKDRLIMEVRAIAEKIWKHDMSFTYPHLKPLSLHEIGKVKARVEAKLAEISVPKPPPVDVEQETLKVVAETRVEQPVAEPSPAIEVVQKAPTAPKAKKPKKMKKNGRDRRREEQAQKEDWKAA